MEFPVTLPPGGAYEDEADLTHWFEFREASQYQIHGAYFLKFIKPGARVFDNIWTEYVSSDFTVRIK